MSDCSSTSLSLDRWELLDFPPGDGETQGAERGAGDGWIPVSAPGDVYLALIEAGRLPHPFKGRHEPDAAWVREREWWWRTTFETRPPQKGERIDLIFEGLDTFAAIYLDGVLIDRTDNMFRRYVFDIGDKLTRAGSHLLSIRFEPPSQAVPPGDLPVWGAFTDRVSRSRRNFMRKAQFGWGWDWGPDLPTVGVWKAARLERHTGPVIRDIAFTTVAIGEGSAEAQIRVEIEPHNEPDLRVEIELHDREGKIVLSQSATPEEARNLLLSVSEPQLWWTADLGEQPPLRSQGWPHLWKSEDRRTARVGRPAHDRARYVA